MKFPIYRRSYVLHLYAVICLAAAAAPVCAQSPPRRALLELKTCGKELQVFEDGTVVESRNGEKTERRLSESRTRKLLQLIARGPCEQEWQRPLPPTLDPRDIRGVPASVYTGDCRGSRLSYGPGLQEVLVTRRYTDHERGSVVYILCERAKESYKKIAKRQYRDYLKGRWQRFLTDVASTVGSKSILKDCNCWQ